ncbi:unnamed protein product [Sympodiomycopsis kandeliae]
MVDWTIRENNASKFLHSIKDDIEGIVYVLVAIVTWQAESKMAAEGSAVLQKSGQGRDTTAGSNQDGLQLTNHWLARDIRAIKDLVTSPDSADNFVKGLQVPLDTAVSDLICTCRDSCTDMNTARSSLSRTRQPPSLFRSSASTEGGSTHCLRVEDVQNASGHNLTSTDASSLTKLQDRLAAVLDARKTMILTIALALIDHALTGEVNG